MKASFSRPHKATTFRWYVVYFEIGLKKYIVAVIDIIGHDAHNIIDDTMHNLYEYRYLQNLPDANLVMVIERELPEQIRWMQDYLENDRGIYLVWDGNDQLYASDKTRNELAFLWQ